MKCCQCGERFREFEMRKIPVGAWVCLVCYALYHLKTDFQTAFRIVVHNAFAWAGR